MKIAFGVLLLFLLPHPNISLFSPEKNITRDPAPSTLTFKSVLPAKSNKAFLPFMGKSASTSATRDFFANGVISVFPLRIYDNDVMGGAAGINRKITVKNTGTGTLSVASASLSGTNINQFVLSGLPSFPKIINAGDSIFFFVAFNPSSAGLKTASLAISSDDAAKPVFSIPLRGLGIVAFGSATEPSLQALLNLLEIDANVGDDSVSTPAINSNVQLQQAQLRGDEISLQKFQKAGAGNVTITPLGVFGPTDVTPVTGAGWYKSGRVSTISELFSVSNNPTSNGQTVNVNFTGTLSFDPAADTFGFFSHWPHFNNRYIYSEDKLNTFPGSLPHHVRVFPYRKNGRLIPDNFIVAFEETTAKLDYNDLIFLVSNVKKVQSNALLFVENLDKFPANDQLVFSRIQIPWTRDSVVYNANHDSVKLRVHNKGLSPLTISDLTISNDTTWKIEKIDTATYIPGSGLPRIINSGAFIDLTLRFIARDQDNRAEVLHETLIIGSNDDKYPLKIVYLNGLWQKEGEGNSEPYAQEILNTFNYKTQSGFNQIDPDLGDSTKLKGSEIKPSFFLRADLARPALIRQMAAYHGCCTTTEKLMWYNKGSATLNTIFTHIAEDAQTLLPRRNINGLSANGSITPAAAFGFKVGFSNFSEASKNPQKKIGIRVWKAINSDGEVIPNAYILSSDYLGTPSTNFDYQDNTYYVSNIKPATGSVFYSLLGSTPSAVDFGEHVLQTSDSTQLSIKNLGQLYANGSSDPSIVISSLEIAGENNAEFSADLPLSTTLTPQQTSSIKVRFNPVSQGLKIADLLIYYNNSTSPLRVPLYGIGKSADTLVIVNYRIKSGSNHSITVNGKTYVADTPFAFDNLEPYSNTNVTQIAATDDDSLYLIEQSSNLDKRPFRYEIPLPNGTYSLRLHFAEIYFGTVGGGSGDEGARVMSVKLENQLRLINFDIAQEAGIASAIIRNFVVTVTDGKLNINFSATANRPSLSAVEVYSFISSGPLPVNDFNLKGSVTENGVELKWVDANETSVVSYEIQRSGNNINFVSLGEVPSTNIAHYSFIDKAPFTANNFYRIRKINADGKSIFSQIVRINLAALFSMKLSPNPVKDIINLEFTGLTADKNADLSIQNVTGSTIKKIPVVLSNQRLAVNISTLNAGVYVIRIVTDDRVITRKFLKK